MQATIEYGPVFAQSLADLATLYTLDWDRLQDLLDKATGELSEGADDQLTPGERVELETLREQAGDCRSQEDANERVDEYPLDFSFAVDSCNPQDWPPKRPDRLIILVTTGGPAARIVIELGESGGYGNWWLEVADWGTGWQCVVQEAHEKQHIEPLIDHWVEMLDSYL